MSNRTLAVLLAIICCSSTARAQTIYADRFGLVTGPCIITSGVAAPNGSIAGNVCDTYVQTTTGITWAKTSGTGTSSGWLSSVLGSGTVGKIPKWTGTGSLSDSIMSEAAGVLTITGNAAITGNASITGTGTIGTAVITGNATIGGTAGITGAVTLGSTIGTATYASQITGWRIDQTGAADFRYLFTDELRAKLFTADAESVLAGSMRVTKSYSTIAYAFTCPALGQGGAALWVYDASTYGGAPVFQAGDSVVIHVLTRATFGPFTITDCVGTVAGYADGVGSGRPGTQFWNFTRGTGANGGAMTANTVVPVNQLVQDLGVSGNGYIELSAVDGANGVNAPYIQTNTWATSPTAANTTTNCRLGNLNGITALNDYGLLCGNFVLNGPFFWMSTRGIEMRNMPLTMFDNGTQVFTVDPHAGSPVLALGNPVPTAYAGGNAGLWAGKDSDGTYKLRIGNPTGNRLAWNGVTLSIVGEGSGITNINGGNIQAGTIQASAINVTPAGAALNDDPYTSNGGAWGDISGVGRPAQIVTGVTNGVVGSTSLRTQTGFSSGIGSVKGTPIDSTKSYRMHLWARSNNANGILNFGINLFNTSGYVATSWAMTNVTVPTTWTNYTAPIPAFPATGQSMAVALNMNWLPPNYTPTGYMEVQDVRVEEILPSTLIKDGAITTAKVAAGAITADQIAANTITVGNLNASGFGDNLIKNGTFEGPAAHALDGWKLDAASSGATFIQQNCCGTRGAGTLYNDPTGGNSQVVYYAVPVQGGQPYRVALDVYATSPMSSGGFYVFMLQSNTTVLPRWITNNGGGGDAASTNNTMLLSNASPPASTWTHYEFTYTPPSGTQFVSFAFLNNSCAQGACSTIHMDAVEMQPQLGAGHIRAASITADRLVANSITSAQIAAGTITAGNIAAGTITSTQIAANTITGGNIAGGTITGGNIAGRTITAGALVANTITSNEIGVRAIVAGNINTGTITANEIAAGTITADRMNVSTLSAITANLGSINAGSLNAVSVTGSTITGSTVTSGCATMNSNGITLTAGGGACNWYKFSNGTIGMSSDGGAWMYVQAQNVQVMGTGSGGYLNLQGDTILHGSNQITLDDNGNQIHLTNNGYLQLQISSLSGTGAGSHMCLTTDNYVVRCA